MKFGLPLFWSLAENGTAKNEQLHVSSIRSPTGYVAPKFNFNLTLLSLSPLTVEEESF